MDYCHAYFKNATLHWLQYSTSRFELISNLMFRGLVTSPRILWQTVRHQHQYIHHNISVRVHCQFWKIGGRAGRAGYGDMIHDSSSFLMSEVGTNDVFTSWSPSSVIGTTQKELGQIRARRRSVCLRFMGFSSWSSWHQLGANWAALLNNLGSELLL